MNEAVRSLAVAPPRAPLWPLSTVMRYFVLAAMRAAGLKVSVVRSAFQVSFPRTGAPVCASRTLRPSAAEGSIGWLKTTTVSCHGPP